MKIKLKKIWERNKNEKYGMKMKFSNVAWGGPKDT
jgi:hypothetical protein